MIASHCTRDGAGTTRAKTCILTALAAVALGLALAGCSDFKKPTSQNFARGLNSYYASHDDCLFPGGLRFPYEVSTRDAPPGLEKKLDALTGAGLLHRTEEQSIHVKRYSFTAYTAYAGSRLSSSFCYGHRVVTGVDNFSPPATVEGRQTTQVSYHYKMMDVPGWAQSPQMLAAFPSLASSLGSEPHATAMMVLTVNGWQVPE